MPFCCKCLTRVFHKRTPLSLSRKRQNQGSCSCPFPECFIQITWWWFNYSNLFVDSNVAHTGNLLLSWICSWRWVSLCRFGCLLFISSGLPGFACLITFVLTIAKCFAFTVSTWVYLSEEPLVQSVYALSLSSFRASIWKRLTLARHKSLHASSRYVSTSRSFSSWCWLCKYLWLRIQSFQ